MQQVQCEACGDMTAGYDIIHYGSADTGYRQICTKCYNDEVAALCGLATFENIRLEPIGIVGGDGKTHEFHFRARLLGNLVSLDAFELPDGLPGGYQFQQVGDPEDDLFALLAQLIQKMRHTISVQHVAIRNSRLEIVDQTVRGRIEWDDAEDGRVPLIVVDGRALSWDEFGTLLMSFEGWQFKLDIIDPSGEV